MLTGGANIIGSMNTQEIVEAIEAQIQRLQRAKELISGTATTRRAGRGPMSAEGRERIAAAQRARWAKSRGAKK